jgi:hypothetical protein
MRKKDADGMPLSVRPDVAATKGITDKVGVVMGDHSWKEAPQSIQTDTSRNEIS